VLEAIVKRISAASRNPDAPYRRSSLTLVRSVPRRHRAGEDREGTLKQGMRGCGQRQRDGVAWRCIHSRTLAVNVPFHDPRQHDDAAYGSKHESKMSACSGASGFPRGGGKPLHDRFQHLRHSHSGLGATSSRVLAIDAHRVLDHLFGALDIRIGQIDLVDDGNMSARC